MMKKFLIISLILIPFKLIFASDYPAYTNGQWLVWNKADASNGTNALTYINTSGWFPITPINAKTGESAVGAEKTMKWSEVVFTFEDERVGFPRIPTETLDKFNVPLSDRTNFFLVFQPTVEVPE